MKRRMNVVDVADTIPHLFTNAITDSRAWKRQDLSPSDWVIALPEECLAECEDVIRLIQKHPQPVEHLTPDMMAFPACAKVMAQVREKLQAHTGIVVLDRVPVEQYSLTENKVIFWLLATLLGPVVSQKWDGTRLYDVKDAGKALGYGTRRSVTNLEQDFHTDGGWLDMPPEYVGLFCLQPAHAGGMSRCVSLLTAHNDLRRHAPDLLYRLYEPFWWDRQAEHGQEDDKSSWHPVYGYDGHTLTARYYDDYMHNGYRLAGATLDPLGAQALHAMRECLEAPDNWLEFHLEKGQILYLNNHQCAHARTAFVDAQAPQPQRHMIRLWNRHTGTSHLEGQEVY